MKTRHKKTCGVCGYPREHFTLGIPYTPCEEHCEGCRQPLIPGLGCGWCCKTCMHFPCECAAILMSDPDYEGDFNDYDSDEGWEHCEENDCPACEEHCSDAFCSECAPCPKNLPQKPIEKVLPPGKTWTGQGGSGYATGNLTPPWEEAGLHNFPFSQAEGLYDSPAEAWPNMRCDEVDPIQRAADFYLLSALTSGALNSQAGADGSSPQIAIQEVLKWHPELTGASIDAQRQLNDLVDDTDRSFVDYIDMACGGELRHHPRVGGKHLNSNRAKSWIAWKSLREIRGVEALMDAFWLFNDFTSGGYGGPLWAGAAQLLHSRLTNKITKTVFVDQAFSLVHNGGVFLNKQHWKIGNGKDLEFLRRQLLPAQSRDDWQVMCDVASREVRELWREGWMDLNKARRKAGCRPTPVPGLRNLKISVCAHCGMNPALGHRSWICKGGDYNQRVDRTSRGSSRSYEYPYPSWAPDGKTMRLYEGHSYTTQTDSKLRSDRTHAGLMQDALKEEREWRGHCKLIYNRQTIWAFHVSEAAKWSLDDLLVLHGIRTEIIADPNPPSVPTGNATNWLWEESESESVVMADDDDDDWFEDVFDDDDE